MEIQITCGSRCTKKILSASRPKKESRRSGSDRACPPLKRRSCKCRRSNYKKKICTSFCTVKFPPPFFPPKPPIPPNPPKDKLMKDELCGIIQQDCNGQFVEYWRSIDISPLHGSVSVFNSSECMMTVKADTNGDGISDIILFTVEKNQTKAVTFKSITNLEISCEGVLEEACSGKYCLSLYYRK